MCRVPAASTTLDAYDCSRRQSYHIDKAKQILPDAMFSDVRVKLLNDPAYRALVSQLAYRALSGGHSFFSHA
jgi:hypothetical protein